MIYMVFFHTRKQKWPLKKKRSIFCGTLSENSIPVDENLCDAFSRPIGSKLCSVPCESKCYYGQWSVWSRCYPGSCEPNQVNYKLGWRRREREVIRESRRGSCTETIQFTSCNQPYCYSLDLVDRGVCRPSNGARCGEGTARLTWQCVDYS